jgi:hypothetical protein
MKFSLPLGMVTVGLGVAGLLASGAALAQAAPNAPPPAAEPAERVPTLVLTDGRRYYGEVLNGRPHGRGVMEWPDTQPPTQVARYEGDYHHGVMHGRGVLLFRNGNRYEGDFALNRFWGRGQLIFLGGTRYEGDFIANEMSGVGVYTFYFNVQPTGQRYEGEFLKGKLNGRGREIARLGLPQEGGFIDGQRAGPWVRYHFDDRERYDKGDYVNGKLEGPGEVRSNKAPAVRGVWRQNGFTPLSLWPKGTPVPERLPEAIAAEEEVNRRSALAQQHHRDAQAMHLASAEQRAQMAQAVLSGATTAVAAAAPAPAPAPAAVRPSAPVAAPMAQPPAPAPVTTPSPSAPAAAPIAPVTAGVNPQLQSLIGQLDRMDQMEWRSHLDKARRCTENQDFDCADASLRQANRYANSPGEKAQVRQQQQVVAEAREELAERRRRIARAEAELAEREERLAQEARRAEEEPRLSMGQILAQGMAAGVNAALADRAQIDKIHNNLMRDVQSAYAERERREQAQKQQAAAAQAQRQRERIEAERAELARQRQALQARPTPATPPPAEPARIVQPTIVVNLQPQCVLDSTSVRDMDRGRPGTGCLNDTSARPGGGSAAPQGGVTATVPTGTPLTVTVTGASTGPQTTAGGDAAGQTARPRPQFRQVPATPPQGRVVEGLNTSTGDYRCTDVNAYARQHAASAQRVFDAYIAAPYRSAAKCQARCDALAWREEVLNVYRYRGSWNCSDGAVKLWNALHSGGSARSYRGGQNDDNCTCVTPQDTPISFSAD